VLVVLAGSVVVDSLLVLVVGDVEGVLPFGFHRVIQMIFLSISFRGWEEVGLLGWGEWMTILLVDLVEVDEHDHEGVVEVSEGVCLGCLKVLPLTQK
jgi:hypothetical protein